jgi:hypothetical protein
MSTASPVKSNVIVTAYGSDSNYCKVVTWASESADIACFTSAGSPSDTRYTITFSSNLFVLQ